MRRPPESDVNRACAVMSVNDGEPAIGSGACSTLNKVCRKASIASGSVDPPVQTGSLKATEVGLEAGAGIDAYHRERLAGDDRQQHPAALGDGLVWDVVRGEDVPHQVVVGLQPFHRRPTDRTADTRNLDVEDHEDAAAKQHAEV